MADRFPYERRVSIGDLTIPSPVIPVSLKRKGFEWSEEAKLDTGADYCLFDREVGERLDIAWDAAPTSVFTTSAGGVVQAHIEEVEIWIDDGLDQQMVRCRVMFADNVRENLIGRMDFFADFRITLCERDNLIEFERVATTRTDVEEDKPAWI